MEFRGICGAPDLTITRIRASESIRNDSDQGVSVELTGFEPVTPSLRKMRSNTVTRGNDLHLRVCGAAVGRAT